MCWFCKKPKSALQLMEEELKRHHRHLNDTYKRDNSARQIEAINAVIREAARVELSTKLEKRFKAIEDAIGDLYLVGKSGDKT